MGVMRQAMAWKIKYRLEQSPGSGDFKFHLSWDMIGASPGNRGCSYPTGSRVKSLAYDILKMGFVSEEANHMGVVVQEAPQSRRLDDYNRKCTKGDKDLESCFAECVQVQFALLNHTHLGLIVKAFRGRAN